MGETEKSRKPNAPENWPEVFLKHFRQTGNVSFSARKALVTRTTVYERKDRDPEFAAVFEEARAESADALEMEARRRATKGTLKPVFYKGKRCGVIREFSDTLLIVLLKGNNPEKFKERGAVEHSGNIGHEHSGSVNHTLELSGLGSEEIQRLYREAVQTSAEV